MKSKKLYLAAPLFSEAEKSYNVYLRNTLSKFYDVYLPQEDGLLMVDLIKKGIDSKIAADLVFKNDIIAIDRCDVLLIVLDGRTVDEGAAFELGMAFSKKKNCVALQTDPRRLLQIGNNPMISCSISNCFSSVTELIEWAKIDCISMKGNSKSENSTNFVCIQEERTTAGC